MSSMNKAPVQKKSKLSRSKTLTKKDAGKVENAPVKALFELGDLNETCDFKEPMVYKRDLDRDDQYKKGQSDSKVGSTTFNTGAAISMETEDTVLCQLCNKDISHMNSVRRGQHVNRCIDKMEDTQKEERQESVQLEKSSRSPVLDCPMCKKAFKSANARQTHLKRCASINNIPTEAMLKLVKTQEQEAENLLPSHTVTQPTNTSKQTKVGPSRKRKIKEPKSQFDEDVQLALAVSSSLANQHKSAAEILEENQKAVSGQNKRRKKKNVLEDVCLLTTLSEEDRQRRVEQKLHMVLVEEDSDVSDGESTPPLHNSSLKVTHSESQKKLWPISNHQDDTGDVMNYYVPSLMPPISTNRLTTGSRLKRLSTIPGRETSFVTDKLDISEKNTSQLEDVFTASTQTAAVLAELAVDDTTLNDSTTLSSPTADVSLQASGFCEETLTMKDEALNQSRQQTLSTFKEIINQSKYSDLTIQSLEGSTFHAHKVIVFNRFPQLLQLFQTSSSSVSLPISKEVTLVFLIYTYTGELQCTASIQNKLEGMANKLNLPSLIQACNSLTTADTVLEDNKKCEIDHSEEESVTEHAIINVKDIWGESDSEGDDAVRDVKRDGTDTECELDKREQICEEDYRQIMCTQKRRNSTEEMKQRNTTEEKEEKSVINNLDYDSHELQGSKQNSKNASGKYSDTNSDSDLQIVDISCKSLNKDEIIQDNSPKDQSFSVIDDDYDNKLSQPSNMEERSRGRCRNSTSPTVTECEKEASLTEDMESSPTFDNTGVQAMDTSNVDLFESPSSPLSSVTSNVGNNSTTPTKSPLFKNKSRTHALQKSNFTVSDIIDINSDSDEENNVEEDKSLSLTQSNCLSALLCDKSADKQLDCVDMVDDFAREQYTSMEVNDKVTDNLSPSLPELNDKDTCHSDSVNDDQLEVSDDELQITGDNFDDILSQSQTKKELNYLGTPVDIRKSDSIAGTVKEVICANRNNTSMKPNQSSPSKGADTNMKANHLKPHKSQCVRDISKSTINHGDEKIEAEDDIELISCDDTSSCHGDVSSCHGDVSSCHGDVSSCHGDTDDKGEGHSSSRQDVSHISFDGDGADVWEDFDDCGIGYSDVTSPIIANQSVINNHNDALTATDEDVTLIEDDDENVTNAQSDPDLKPGDPDLVDQPHADLLDDNDDSFVFRVEEQTIMETKMASQFKTPTTSNKCRQQKKEWVPPSPFTPMPEYNKMNTPMLKKEVKRYGVKPVGKKRMVTVLTDIYHKTHQYETDSEFEDDPVTDIANGDDGPDVEEDIVLSQNTLPSSQESDMSDLMEESILLGESTSDSDTQSSPQKGVDIKKRLHSYITSNQDLHLRVLMYEPLEVDVLKADLKEAGIKCSMDKLLEFLDEKCIAFTSKNSRKRKPSKRGKKKVAAKS